MKVKKLISVLLATGMIATVAAGCGGDGGSGSAGESRILRVGKILGEPVIRPLLHWRRPLSP